jgi:hypothetical protein
MSLRNDLALYGFESNADYSFALQCVLDAESRHVRCLHVDGSAGRRKTAFANALGSALSYPRICYHDFSLLNTPAARGVVSVEDTASELAEPAMTAFERVITEACAYSESDRCLLIVDQLQAAGFVDQMRLTGFLRNAEWSSQAGTVIAHRGNLLVVLICEGELYHSLAKLCFRVWTDAELTMPDYRPEDYGWSLDAQPVFTALAQLFAALPFSPTPSEFSAVLDDLAHRVHGEEQLRQSLFGRCEGLARTALHVDAMAPMLSEILDRLQTWRGVDHIEL